MIKAFNLPSPLESVPYYRQRYGVDVWVKRDDLIHPVVSGNKWRKLAPYFTKMPQRIISMGGAHSNHLHAMAFVAHHLGISSVGWVRGESHLLDTSATLQQCVSLGMELVFLSSQQYKAASESPTNFTELSKDDCWVPMGGASSLGVEGATKIMDEIDCSYDYVFVPLGTGTTMAGILRSAAHSTQIIGVSPYNGDKSWLVDAIEKYSPEVRLDWTVLQHEFGVRFGQMNSTFYDQIKDLYQRTGMLPDPVYNSKAMLQMDAMIRRGEIAETSTVIYIHTGGLQGWSDMLKKHQLTPFF